MGLCSCTEPPECLTYLPGVQGPHQLGENGLTDDRVDGAMDAATDQLGLHQEVPVTHAVRR